ncbi:MAG: 16S rRNA (guanine(527)-N(7))-methyltransferase RsmG [Geobacteraceae bacterium]
MNKEALDVLRSCAATFGINLSVDEQKLFNVFAEELKKWNRRINLTAIKDDREIVIKHFADSFSLISCLAMKGKLLDIGSGGGFPAIPLKILLQGLSVVSVDAVEKKILFQRHVARVLQLQDFQAIHSRVEDLTTNFAEQFDIVVSRAFSDLTSFVGLALPLLKNTGRIIAMKGREGKEEANIAEKKIVALGAKVVDCIHLRLPESGAERFFVILEKNEK